jgi:hypothetical protein
MLSTKDEVVRYVLQTFDTNLALTLGEACDASRKYPRTHFASVATQVISGGFLIGKGDGFVIRYSLTKKGRAELGQTKGVDPGLASDALLKRKNPQASGMPHPNLNLAKQ